MTDTPALDRYLDKLGARIQKEKTRQEFLKIETELKIDEWFDRLNLFALKIKD